ncbi:hypothetical protein [Flavobacterium soli]|uniref:hypothetical protein n=1 Tax=Flavobacterium soli TaxID=344881 RepID=UPI000422B9FE|nr:hypothetical protein [Flavobacterium soli]
MSEKIFYSMVSSIIGLILGTYLIDTILGFFYGYDDFHGELNAPMLLKNILFYFSTSSISIALFTVWLRYKKNIYE